MVSQRHRLQPAAALLADVGATNARFAALSAEGRIQRVRVLACEDYSSIEEAIELT